MQFGRCEPLLQESKCKGATSKLYEAELRVEHNGVTAFTSSRNLGKVDNESI
jgi:hypothetical protein